jgi:restriction system protein
VERILAGLGFKTILTPPSKDGGKDVIADCELNDGTQSYIVELKHWRSGKEVGQADVAAFVEVVAHEKRTGGLLLSTSGFAGNAFATVCEVTRQRVRCGNRNKIVSMAQRYEKVATGLWSPTLWLPEVLFEFSPTERQEPARYRDG